VRASSLTFSGGLVGQVSITKVQCNYDPALQVALVVIGQLNGVAYRVSVNDQPGGNVVGLDPYPIRPTNPKWMSEPFSDHSSVDPTKGGTIDTTVSSINGNTDISTPVQIMGTIACS
jgi:hypothetical protein